MIPTPTDEEVTRRLKEASDLTELCLSLPRLATRGEERARAELEAWLSHAGEKPALTSVRAALSVAWARGEFEWIASVGDRLTPEELLCDDRIDTFVFHARELLAR